MAFIDVLACVLIAFLISLGACFVVDAVWYIKNKKPPRLFLRYLKERLSLTVGQSNFIFVQIALMMVVSIIYWSLVFGDQYTETRTRVEKKDEVSTIHVSSEDDRTISEKEYFLYFEDEVHGTGTSVRTSRAIYEEVDVGDDILVIYCERKSLVTGAVLFHNTDIKLLN